MKTIWNAHVDVEGATVGLGWGVPDETGDRPLDYEALITVTLPEQATASIGKKAPNETVLLATSASLACGPEAVEATVTYRVSRKEGASGNQVAVNVARVAGQKPPSTGDVLAQGGGLIGEEITVEVAIPGSCA